MSDVHRLQLPHTLCWLLKTLNELANQRDRLFRAHEQGKMTADEVLNRFVALMIRASNDSAALALCDSMPEWFCDHFLAYLENQENGVRWFSMEDPRSTAQVDADAKQHRDLVDRLRAQIITLLGHDDSQHDSGTE